MNIFRIKAVPVVGWSSKDAFNLRPPPVAIFWLFIGLVLFGVGETMLIAAGIGVSPWTVLAQGVSASTGIGIGAATFWVSVAILALWIPLRQKPGIGTLSNVVIIAATIEFALPYIPEPEGYAARLALAVSGTLTVGIGSGIYLVANLGPGPRDGLMTGLQRFTNRPISWVRTFIELSAVGCGWLLGGTVGIGTVIFALGIGPAVSAGLYLTARCSGHRLGPEAD